MKRILLSLDKFISDAGEAFALMLAFGGLTILNTLSISHLYAEQSAFAWIMSALLGITISVSTITIVRAERDKYPELGNHLKALKIIYPVFDAILVFEGFNVEIMDKITMSIFFALLLGLSMYALGLLNLHKRKTNPQVDSHSKNLQEKNFSNLSEFEKNEISTPENEKISLKSENLIKEESPETAKINNQTEKREISFSSARSENPEKERIVSVAKTMLEGEISRENIVSQFGSQNKFIASLIEKSGTNYSKSTVQGLISGV